jgi:hypothetical protein
MSESTNFGFSLRPGGDLIMGKDINSILEEIDEKLFNALYGDHIMFTGAALAIADPGPGATAAIVLTPFPELVFPDAVTLKKVRVIVPLATNSVAAPGIEVNFRKVGTLVALLPAGSIEIPVGAALDVLVDFPAGVDIDDDEEVEAYVENVTIGVILGTFDLSPMVVAADIKYAAE